MSPGQAASAPGRPLTGRLGDYGRDARERSPTHRCGKKSGLGIATSDGVSQHRRRDPENRNAPNRGTPSDDGQDLKRTEQPWASRRPGLTERTPRD